MTIFLVIAFFLIAVAVDWEIRRRRQRVADAARSAVWLVDDDSSKLLFHPGHTWVQIHSDNMVSVGTSDFASSFAGSLAKIKLPEEGSLLRQADSAWTLVSEKGRKLEQLMPIDGRVLAVNSALLEDPGLAQRRPYGEGWILRIRPHKLAESLRNLFPASVARAWLEAVRAAIGKRLSPALGTLAQDGGELLPEFGDCLDDAAWGALAKELFPSSVDHEWKR